MLNLRWSFPKDALATGSCLALLNFFVEAYHCRSGPRAGSHFVKKYDQIAASFTIGHFYGLV